MQFDINYWVEALRAGIDMVPAPIAAMILLGGPTAGWLLYRFIVQPRHSRMRGLDPSTLWVCHNCRSVNAMRLERCYRCDSLPEGEDLEVIDPHPAGPVRMLPVGPGLDLGGGGRPLARPRPVTQIERANAVWAEDEERRPALRDVDEMEEVLEAPARRRPVSRSGPNAVGPGRAQAPVRSMMPRPAAPAPRPAISGRPAAHRPAVIRPRRAIVVGPSQDPDDSPAA